MDGWRLALGTLTALPVQPPSTVSRSTARVAMLAAPLAVLPLGAAVAVVLLLGDRADLPSLAVGTLGVAALVLGNRAFHVDGLSDTADGLAASYDRERSLAVMKSGTSGPAGGVAVLLVLMLQVSGAAELSTTWRGALLAGLLVCVSRCALALTCAAGVPGARPDGLGGSFVGVVPVLAAIASWLIAAALVGVVGSWAGLDWWRGVVAVAVTLVAVLLLVRRTTTRFGGVTGDVFGAAIEVALAALLVVCA
ncbi:MAG: adenosylcobinamide-GDP ribazoletransferase [Marmoricola sp.]|nr:adenosylcobinamide-GDP ribazoletransferase [Marmoricola sp.]